MNCEYCGKEHSGSFASGRFCNRSCSSGFSTKLKRKEINIKISKKLKGRNDYSWNKGKSTLYTTKCLFCAKEIKSRIKNRKFCSKSCVGKFYKWSNAHNKLTSEQWSIINKKAYTNGHNYVAGGTAKWLNYKDIKVQGTYELRTCKILDKWKELGIIKNWEYTKDRFEYIGFDNKKHSYLLDFKVYNNDNSFYYVEVKGYKKENDELKWNSVKCLGYKLEVWFLDSLNYYENKIGI